MVIDTKEISARIKLGSMIVIVLLAAVALFDFIYSKVVNDKDVNVLLYWIVAVVFVLFETYMIIKKYTYINYNSDGFKIIMKYTSLGMLSAGNYKIEIPKKDFIRAELKKSIFGLRKKILIYVKTPQGIAKFKPICVTVLSKKELDDLMNDFESLKR